MATKNFLSLENLTQYDGLIKQYIGTEDAKSIKSITVVGNTVNFFKTEDASGTAAYTVNIPDVSNFMEKISGATGGKVVTSASDGTVAESNVDTADILTKIDNAHGGRFALTTSAGDITESALEPSSFVTGYFNSPDEGHLIVRDDINRKDIRDVDLTIDELMDALDSIGEIPAGATATTVVGYAAEVADAAETAANSYTDTEIAAIEAKLAGVFHYKGVVATVSNLPATAENGDVYHVTEESAEYAYFVNGSTGAWEELGSVVDLSDYSTTTEMNSAIATAKSEAISAAATDATTKADAAESAAKTYASGLVTTLDNSLASVAKSGAAADVSVADADDNFTATTVEGVLAELADDIDSIDTGVMSVTEGSTNGTLDVDGTDVPVHGLGSAAYTASTAYDASGAAATAKSEVIGTSGDAASADTINGAKAYADASTAAISSADIAALFN